MPPSAEQSWPDWQILNKHLEILIATKAFFETLALRRAGRGRGLMDGAGSEAARRGWSEEAGMRRAEARILSRPELKNVLAFSFATHFLNF